MGSFSFQTRGRCSPNILLRKFIQFRRDRFYLVTNNEANISSNISLAGHINGTDKCWIRLYFLTVLSCLSFFLVHYSHITVPQDFYLLLSYHVLIYSTITGSRCHGRHSALRFISQKAINKWNVAGVIYFIFISIKIDINQAEYIQSWPKMKYYCEGFPRHTLPGHHTAAVKSINYI